MGRTSSPPPKAERTQFATVSITLPRVFETAHSISPLAGRVITRSRFVFQQQVRFANSGRVFRSINGSVTKPWSTTPPADLRGLGLRVRAEVPWCAHHGALGS